MNPDQPSEGERRARQRWPVVRTLKLQDPATGRYHLGWTKNLSTAGALIRLAGRCPLEVGQQVRLGLAQPGQVLMSGEQFVTARIVRVDVSGQGPSFGMAFEGAIHSVPDLARAA